MMPVERMEVEMVPMRNTSICFCDLTVCCNSV